MSRAISVTELITTNFKSIQFSGQWKHSIGNPQLTGSWLVWGDSGNGKTRFVLQLCKYLANFRRVAYNSLEEGASASMKTAFIETDMLQVKKKIILLDKESMTDLKKRLKRHKSPGIVVIDSVQYTGMNYKQYIELKEMFPKKLFILISHADGKLPSGRVAKSIRFDAFVKIRVEGYKAFFVSRYGGGAPYTIWRKGASEYWNEIE
jgi:hypothetical protein